ncbi:hypothetical protein SK128_004604 [Halocaridina rubra]|uniref:Uncharacterized protein n=1 Tax=Halocaridina rubra TaxID=373956 RepID=A0AAN9AHL5_HALRR
MAWCQRAYPLSPKRCRQGGAKANARNTIPEFTSPPIKNINKNNTTIMSQAIAVVWRAAVTSSSSQGI